MNNYSATMNVMMKAARKAARGLTRDFSEVANLQVSRKGPGDFVSVADTKAENVIFDVLSEARPGYSFIMEERGDVKGTDEEYRWIVDPLDGTTNFLHSHSVFCINIALEKRDQKGNREIVSALTYAPLLKETFWAEKGSGAWFEDENCYKTKLRVARRQKISEAMVVVGSLKRNVNEATNIVDKVAGLRTIGSTALALAYVAAGRFDCFFQSNAQSWDIASGILLVKEAGGLVQDMNGSEKCLDNEAIIAGNSDMLRLVGQHLAKK